MKNIKSLDNFLNEAAEVVDVLELSICYITSTIADKNTAGEVIENVRSEISYALMIPNADKYEVKKQKIQTTQHCTEITMTVNLPQLYITRKGVEEYRIRDMHSAVMKSANILSAHVFLSTKNANLSI